MATGGSVENTMPKEYLKNIISSHLCELMCSEMHPHNATLELTWASPTVIALFCVDKATGLLF